jgi:AraC-like DNA-binding protein
MPNRKKLHHFDPVHSGKGLFRSLIAGEGRTLTEAFAYLAERKTVAHVYRHPHRALLGARIALAPEEGEGYWNFTQIGDDVYVVAGRFAYKDPRVEFVAGDGLLQFYFTLTGDLTMAISRTERFRINRPSLFVYTQPAGQVIKEWTPAGAHERFVAIVLRPQFLVDLLLGSSSEAPPLLQAFIAGTLKNFESFQLPLNARMFEIAAKFVDNSYAGTMGLVYTEAITLELLCSAIESLKSVSAVPTEQYTERELRCMYAARDYLMKQLAPAPGIRQVARAAGINETTLKRGFKAVFGETPFEFSVRCRMQHALVLLRDREMQVARVAVAVGYSHQTSFATAFRRHFGLRPKDVRRGRFA